jgi:hypothetical protein
MVPGFQVVNDLFSKRYLKFKQMPLIKEAGCCWRKLASKTEDSLQINR